MRLARWKRTGALALSIGAAVATFGQAPAPAKSQPESPANQTEQQAPEIEQHRGKVLFQSHGEPPEPDSDRTPMSAKAGVAEGADPAADRERAALFFTAYDLDVHVQPATSQMDVRARVTVRNDGAVPLTQVRLQVSSALVWQSVHEAGAHRALAFVQNVVPTDTDHTGAATEAVVTLVSPLAPGATVALDVFYGGKLQASAERLRRIGASPEQAAATDWDAVGPAGVDLRGFGNVVWYPVSSPAAFLGEGARLFEAIGKTKLREETASVRLRLSVAYTGEPPVAAYFCGRRREFQALSDNADAPTATGSGIAVAEFAAAPLGFRTPSLFVVNEREQMGGGTARAGAAEGSSSSSGSPAAGPAEDASGTPLLAVATEQERVLPRLNGEAAEVAPLLEDWLGPRPLTVLTIVDHPGQPFEDGPLLVAPVESLASSSASQAMAHSLTHAWVDTGQPWVDEGLAQFFALEWTERSRGREAAVNELRQMVQPLGLGEPNLNSAADLASAPPGQPLIAAWDEVFFRRKAAAVWWMLRDIAGEAALKQALSAWRVQPVSHEDARAQAAGFEHLLEKTSGKDLRWFFEDWVLRDVGLPDLSITDVTPRALPAGKGHDSGWLVAVTVRNDGAAAAEVPVVVRAGLLSASGRIRVPGFASATERVLIEARPTDVAVNDGTVPETRTSVHTRVVNIQTQ